MQSVRCDAPVLQCMGMTNITEDPSQIQHRPMAPVSTVHRHAHRGTVLLPSRSSFMSNQTTRLAWLRVGKNCPKKRESKTFLTMSTSGIVISTMADGFNGGHRVENINLLNDHCLPQRDQNLCRYTEPCMRFVLSWKSSTNW